MNRMIAKELIAKGWTRQHQNGSRYWSADVFSRKDWHPAGNTVSI